MRSMVLAAILGFASIIATPALAAQGAGADERDVGADAADPARTPLAWGLTEVPHTVTSWCVDLSELWHVSVPVVVPRGMLTRPATSSLPPCPTTSLFPIQVPAGSGWSMGADVWFMNKTYPPAVVAALRTAGYHFVSGSPTEDLLQKMVAVRYDVWLPDRSALVASFTFDPRATFRLVRAKEHDGALPPPPFTDLSSEEWGRLPAVHFSAVGGALDLPEGMYLAEVYWILSELHNDGLGLEPLNFLASGSFRFASARFQLVR